MFTRRNSRTETLGLGLIVYLRLTIIPGEKGKIVSIMCTRRDREQRPSCVPGETGEPSLTCVPWETGEPRLACVTEEKENQDQHMYQENQENRD